MLDQEYRADPFPKGMNARKIRVIRWLMMVCMLGAGSALAKKPNVILLMNDDQRLRRPVMSRQPGDRNSQPGPVARRVGAIDQFSRGSHLLADAGINYMVKGSVGAMLYPKFVSI